MKEQTTFLEKLSNNFIRYADRIALSDGINSREFTYRDLDVISGKVYSYLSRNGIGPEDFVMINLPRGSAVFVACIGVWRAGAAFTICEEGYPKEKIDYIYRDCKCRLKITVDTLKTIFNETYKSGYVKCDEHTAAYAGYTSGTTGNPKGIIHEIGTLINNRKSHSYEGREIFCSDDVLGLIAPLNFAAAVMQMNPVLYAGAQIAVAPYEYAKDPVKLRQYFEAKKVTVGFLTPSLVHIFTELPPSLRILFLSSEPACNIHFDNINVYNMYAQTETGCVCAAFKVDKPYPLTPIGRSQIEELDLQVLDENNRKCNPGEMGELCFENKFFRGYMNLPEMTENAKRGGIYHTGDIGKYLPDGSIVLMGRNDDMVKINGNRVEPAEIEKVLKDVLKVKWAAAKAIKTEKRIFICAYYTEEPTVGMEYAKQRIAEKLPNYMVPTYYMRIDSVPMNANGKFSRKDLPEPDVSVYMQGNYAAPQTKNQKLIANAFKDVLKIEKVGIDDDFYQLGGDSISSMQIVAALPQLNIMVSDIFKGRTVRKIEGMLSDRNTMKYTEEANEAALKKEHPLTPFQQFIFDYQLYTPYSTMWNLPVCFKTRRQNKRANLITDALRTVINAHPALKTRIRFGEDGELVQYYDDSEPIIKSEEVTEAEMVDIQENLIRPFEMIESPLFRCRIFKTEQNVYLFMDLHHIVGDGTSIHILTSDFAKVILKGQELKKDFYYLLLEEKEKSHTTKQYIADKKYYDSLYKDIEWNIHPEPDYADRSNTVSSISAEIPIYEDVYKRLMNKYGTSENAFFIGITLLAQAQMSRAKNVMLTWTFSGRDSANKQNIIGTLLCDLPVGVRITDGMTMSDFMQEVRKQVSGGLAHTAYPYSFLENDSVGITDKTCFIYQKNIFNLSKLVLDTVHILELPNHHAAASNLFDVEVIDNGDGKTLFIGYESSRYKEETIHQFRRNFQKIAARLVQYEDKKDLTINDIIGKIN